MTEIHNRGQVYGESCHYKKVVCSWYFNKYTQILNSDKKTLPTKENEDYNPGQKSWDILPTNGLCLHLPLPTLNTTLLLITYCQAQYSNIALREGGFRTLNNDFTLQKYLSIAGILLSVPRCFGQHC